MKKGILLIAFLSCIGHLSASDHLKKDTLYTELKNDIVILSSTKETNSLKSLPAAVSIFSPKNLEALQVHSLKDLSAIVPNYFAADYGSKMTAPLYIRGVGARSGDQTVSMYVDNIPYFNTTSFDCELFDIQRVEVLRGTQGTLYGRNSMGGIINIYTFSPLTYEGIKMKVEGGSHGLFSANASHYRRINDKMGTSLSMYYRKDNGYFTNTFTGKKVDDIKNAGGRAKFAWDIKPNFSANYSISFDYLDQGAFPYANIKTNEINYNSEGYYKRKLLTNGLALRYTGQGYEINSTTGYQYLNDEMNMDQDYTKFSFFQINQQQNQNSLSQEITIKSNNKSNYQWSSGVYGFYDYLHTTPPVYMMKDGVKMILERAINKGLEMGQAHAPQGMKFPTVNMTDETIDINGQYKRPTYGAAVFHQSTFNNILNTKGLSLTLGLRLDYEKTKLNYDADIEANYELVAKATKAFKADSLLHGSASNDFLELLPKAVLKHQFSPKSYIYISASRGYKTGGHNIQLFADLLQEALQQKMMNQIMGNMVAGLPPHILQQMPPKVLDRLTKYPPAEDITGRISYKPEYSWNYELGGSIELINNSLSTNFALYYMDVRDVQITQFVKSGGGRLISNAGTAVSKGAEIGLKARPCEGFYLYGNYGFSDARFKNYAVKDSKGAIVNDYTDNHIPFAPQSTFSLGGSISYNFKNNTILDKFTLDTNYAGVGRIYWNEANNLSQGFYGTLNAHLALEKSIFTLELWGKNILDRSYDTFMFESMGNHYAQKGKPCRWGASLKINL